MLQEFIYDIKLLYKSIIEGEKPSLIHFKNKWFIKKSIGEEYQRLCKREDKKEKGSFYTPYEVVDYMVTEIIEKIDYKDNQYIKILDPSCGGGYFLMALLEKLKVLAEDAGIEKPSEHILRYNLYGFDIDETAIMITALELYEKTGCIAHNVRIMDFLFESNGVFDVIIGNPPYMGHKVIKKDYRERLSLEFRDVFKDKGDLAYCFIKKSIDSLRNGGILCFFTSRYILEALNGADIRRYILEKGSINRLIDFYGVRVVKGAGVDTIIMEFVKGNNGEKIDFYRLKSLAKGMGSKVFKDIGKETGEYTKHTDVKVSELEGYGWVFLDEVERNILSKINGEKLEDICLSFQGIITGCDGAFVVDEDSASELGLERELLKPWIKGGSIGRFSVLRSKELLIYSDLIEDEGSFKESIKYISAYRERLEGRRECIKGTRRWYELQWGRDMDIFNGRKIVFPYKASQNRFSIDEGNFFSADVYALKLREEKKREYSYEYLVGILNSRIYEFYIKTMAKKLGEDLYEYYPNKIMKIRIPRFIQEVEKEVFKMERDVRDRIDEILKQRLGITEEEYKVIISWCC